MRRRFGLIDISDATRSPCIVLHVDRKVRAVTLANGEGTKYDIFHGKWR